MAIHEILEVPDPRLKTVSTDVTDFGADLKTLVDDMFETMYAANGIGLAAIQIGVPSRVLVIDLQPEDPDADPVECDHDGHAHTHPATKNEPRIFINPVIVDPADQLATYQEGCLSVPEIYADVDRPETCTVEYKDVDGKAHSEDLTGLMATCIQHEMDHLNGVLFIDHLSRLKKQMALKKLKKLRAA
ncbi:MAG: peptide deformylase [Marinomonas sp.]